MSKKKKVKKMALGGVAKIRHDEATANGMPKKAPSRGSKESSIYY